MRASSFPAAVIEHGTTGGAMVNARSDIGWVKETSNGETIRDVLCEMDRRGQKTGAGYYDYDPETRAAKPSPVTEKIIQDFVAKSGVNPRQISDEEI